MRDLVLATLRAREETECLDFATNVMAERKKGKGKNPSMERNGTELALYPLLLIVALVFSEKRRNT
jgi:hypothetical protein